MDISKKWVEKEKKTFDRQREREREREKERRREREKTIVKTNKCKARKSLPLT